MCVKKKKIHLKLSTRNFSREFSAGIELSDRSFPGGGEGCVEITFSRGRDSGDKEFVREGGSNFPKLFNNDPK